ncbi:methyltransferase domain-containing protein [Actinomadura geliboluensis]|uniref:methyltransferase domain-containing protein n=1 Tax=Actinomadura geliboluensis TaxID=882440 RepID=UPI00371FA04D
MTTVRDSEDFSPSLRMAMVDELRGMGAITSEGVARAVSTVPRHRFVPGQPLEAAYAADQAVVVKRDGAGTALSSLSSAHIQAVMLEQAQVEPGMRVLEVGSGGYNAALLAELVGERGQVVSIDIDPEITERARACLDAAGYQRVRVVLGDAEHGVPGGGSAGQGVGVHAQIDGRSVHGLVLPRWSLHPASSALQADCRLLG